MADYNWKNCDWCGKGHDIKKGVRYDKGFIIGTVKFFCSNKCKVEWEKQNAPSGGQNDSNNNDSSRSHSTSNDSSILADGARGSVEVVKGTFSIINKLKWVIVGVVLLGAIWLVIRGRMNKGRDEALMKQMQAQSDSLIAAGNAQSKNNSEPIVTEEKKPEQTTTAVAINKNDVIAEWTGDFGKDKLLINIQSIDDNGSVTGFDEVKGNKRTLTGNCEQTDNGFKFRLSEPGDDKWDGVFTFNFDNNTNQLKGEWVANNGKSTKQFNLIKK